MHVFVIVLFCSELEMVAHVSKTAPQEPEELAPPPTSQEPDIPQESQRDSSESAGKKRPAGDSMENESKHTRLQQEGASYTAVTYKM